MSTTDETQRGCRDWITYSIHLYHQFNCWWSLKQSVINPNCTLSTTSNLSHYLTKELCVSADSGHCSYAWTVTSRQSLCLLCIIEHDPGQDCSQFIAGIFPPPLWIFNRKMLFFRKDCRFAYMHWYAIPLKLLPFHLTYLCYFQGMILRWHSPHAVCSFLIKAHRTVNWFVHSTLIGQRLLLICHRQSGSPISALPKSLV